MDADSYCIHCEQPHTECICKKKHRVKLFRSEQPGLVLAVVEGSNVRYWAKELGSIAGVLWTHSGSDFAYAAITDRESLLGELETEGYDVEASDYRQPKP